MTELQGASEKTFALSGFTRINAGETFNLSVEKGTAFSIKATGCTNDLNDLDLSVQPGGILDIHYNRFNKHRYRVDFEISLPELEHFNLGGAANGRISGFDLQAAHILTSLDGTSTCEINAVPLNVLFDLGGTSKLTLWGVMDLLKGTAGGAANLAAYNTTSKETEVQTDGTAKVYVVPVQKLKASAGGASRIYYKGAPAQLNIQEAGAGRLVKE